MRTSISNSEMVGAIPLTKYGKSVNPRESNQGIYASNQGHNVQPREQEGNKYDDIIF